MQVDVGEVVPERLERGDERSPGVPAAVGEQRDASGCDLHHDLPGREGHRGHRPGQILAAGPRAAAQHADHPQDGDGGHRYHDRFPGQRPEGQQRGGQYRTAAPDREQAGQQADGGERLRGIPGQAGEEAEVPGDQQPGQRVPSALAGEQGAQVAERADGGDVERDQRDRDQEVLPGRDHPGQHGIADPHVPVGPVHGDAVRGVVEVQRVERQPVEELPVVAVRLGHRHAGRQLGRRGEVPADQDEPADVAVRPGLPADQGEGHRGERGDQRGHGGAVGPGR